MTTLEEILMNKSLYTSSDIKIERDNFIKLQKGIDPILMQPFSEIVCLDHDHSTQNIRAALNRNTNAFEGLVVNAHKRCLKWLTDLPLPDILRNLAAYLEKDYSANPYHTAWLKRVQIDFKKLNANQQKIVLEKLGSEIGNNLEERLLFFKKKTLDRSLGYATISSLLNSAKE